MCTKRPEDSAKKSEKYLNVAVSHQRNECVHEIRYLAMFWETEIYYDSHNVEADGPRLVLNDCTSSEEDENNFENNPPNVDPKDLLAVSKYSSRSP